MDGVPDCQGADAVCGLCRGCGQESAECGLARTEKPDRHLDHNTLFDWASSRWFECLIPIFGFMSVLGGVASGSCPKLEAEGVNYELLFRDFPGEAAGTALDLSHPCGKPGHEPEAGSSEIPAARRRSEAYAETALETLRRYHSMAVDHFTGDECLSGDSPIQGLSCAVLWKPCIPMKPLLSVSGGAKWGDRLERLAFNALPATLSEDMWTHQYLQMTNQPECSILPEDHVVFRTNSGESTFSAWNPHFGCCTSISARDGPSWRFLPFKERKKGLPPRFWFLPGRNGDWRRSGLLQAGIEYPFHGKLKYTVETARPVEFTLAVRIPSFCSFRSS